MNELDILLISTPSPNPGLMIGFEYQGMPPLGLGYLATYLKEEGYSVKIIDLSFRDNNIETIMSVLKNNPTRIIGFSCTTETYKTGVRLAGLIKKAYSNSLVVFGGPHVSFEYESALNTDIIDYVVLSEGENSLKQLCDYCIKGKGTLEDVKGIAYKKDGIVYCTEPQPFIMDLDTLPFPDRTLFQDFSEYAHPATILTSRGCPGKCIFCAASVLSGGKYRMRSAKNIVSEFEYLKSLGFTHVDIIDDTMTANTKRLNECLDELIVRNLQMTWYCESRVDVMSKTILEKMKTAGLSIIQFGVESGSQKILDSIKKNITLEQIHNVFQWCRELKITASTNMIIGQPSDDLGTVNDSFLLAQRIASLGASVNFTVCTPFPGTPIWEEPENFGISFVEHDLDKYSTFYPVINTRHLNANDIRNAYYDTVVALQKLQPNNLSPSLKKYIRRVDAFQLK